MALRWATFALTLAAVACNEETGTKAACKGPADCDALRCIAASDVEMGDLEPLALACGAERPGGDAGESCENAEDCRSGICALAGACVTACERSRDCAARERCQLVYARGTRARLHPIEACVAMIDLPADTEIAIETREVAFSGALDAIALPPTATNTQFVVEHLDDESWPVPAPDTSCRPAICPDSLAPNDDTAPVWFDRAQLTATTGPINPVAVGDHVYPLTVVVPAGPRAQSSTTGYTLTVESKQSGRARLTQISRAPRGGQLDLNVYDAGAMLSRSVLTAALEEVDRIFAPADVFVGDVRHIEITGELLERGGDLPNSEASRGFAELRVQYRVYPQLPELFKLSAGAGNAALDVFLVADIEPGTSGDVGGIAGGTPVPFGMHGTGASGVALAADAGESNPEALGRRMAHEIGHALGLFHTVERNGDVFDPLPDTPVCDAGRDRDRNGLDARECEGAGADNLMFPTTDADASQLTADQADVLRRAMLLR